MCAHDEFCFPAKLSDTPPAKLSVQTSEQFSSDRVVVILEWTLSSSLSRYQQMLLTNISINIIPKIKVEANFIGNMSFQLTLPYNTLYSVSLTQPGICGQPNQTIYIALKYSTHYASDIINYYDCHK